MAKLTDKIRERILSDFNIGKSQNWLANEYELSPATINKICKGLTPKYKDKVNAIVSIKSELSQESEYQSECFDKEVNEKLKNKKLINSNAELLASHIPKVLKSLVTKSIDDDGKETELYAVDAKTIRELAEANDKLSLTLKVNERHAPRAEVKLTNGDDNSTTNTQIVFKRIGSNE